MKNALWLLPVFLLAGLFPGVTNRLAAVAERAAAIVKRRGMLTVLAVAALPMLVRLVLLPWWPIPSPRILDEFCYIYAADTFAAGRAVNPGHPLWQFFEAPHFVAHPLMFSKYPPAQGLMLAVGQVLFGNPWFGVWLSSGLLCASCYWLFLAILPRRWALLGALIPACYVALSSYWMNSYWGGNVAASAGAIMLGAYLRLRRDPTAQSAAAFAAGWSVLAASRPFEGAVFFALPLAGALAFGNRRLPVRVWMAGAATATIGVVLLGGYNTAVTGRPWTLPYTVYMNEYQYVPPIAFMPLQPKPVYRQEIMQTIAEYDETLYQKMIGPAKYEWLGSEWWTMLTSVLPAVLVVPLGVLIVPLVRRRRTRWLIAFLAFGMFILSIETFHFAHYFAPFVPLLFLVTVLALRNLAAEGWRRAALITLLAGAAVESGMAVRHEIRPPAQINMIALRPVVQAQLEEGVDDHLVFVRDTVFRNFLRASWVYNRADMSKARIIWAADLGETENAKLIAMYPGRRIWLLPIEPPLVLLPYHSNDPLQQPVRFQ